MNIIDSWDWRYRVAFDQSLRSRVEESIRKMIKSARCKSLELFHGTNAEKIQGDIRVVTSHLGYSKAVASSSIEYYFQYPGMGLSYALGALWFEHRFSTTFQ